MVGTDNPDIIDIFGGIGEKDAVALAVKGRHRLRVPRKGRGSGEVGNIDTESADILVQVPVFRKFENMGVERPHAVLGVETR